MRLTQPLPLLVIGQPQSLRVRSFLEAARARGHPEPCVLSHCELLFHPERLLELDTSPRLVRIESWGEDAMVQRALLDLGYEEHRRHGGRWSIAPDELKAKGIEYGEVLCPKQAARGHERYLRALQAVFAERPGWHLLQPPTSIRRLFNKSDAWKHHRRAQLPVPDALPIPGSVDQLLSELQERGWREAYVKVVSGSSASGLGLFESSSGSLLTSLGKANGRWYNHLRPRRYTDKSTVREILSILVGESCHVERGLTKARVAGRYVDYRVLMIDGRPAFIVERRSRHPMTNLHLGGSRGNVTEVRWKMGERAWGAMLRTAEQASRLHGCFHLGLDIAVLSDFKRHAILEANAFGDLLPGLTLNGLSVYDVQLNRLEGRGATS